VDKKKDIPLKIYEKHVGSSRSIFDGDMVIERFEFRGRKRRFASGGHKKVHDENIPVFKTALSIRYRRQVGLQLFKPCRILVKIGHLGSVRSTARRKPRVRRRELRTCIRQDVNRATFTSFWKGPIENSSRKNRRILFLNDRGCQYRAFGLTYEYVRACSGSYRCPESPCCTDTPYFKISKFRRKC